MRTRFRFGKIFISRVLLGQSGAYYVVHKKNRWYIFSLNVPTVWRFGHNAANFWVWVLNVDGRGLQFLMLGNDGVDWKRWIS